LVAMRARNPWVRARFKLPGWNVRFIVFRTLSLDCSVNVCRDSFATGKKRAARVLWAGIAVNRSHGPGDAHTEG